MVIPAELQLGSILSAVPFWGFLSAPKLYDPQEWMGALAILAYSKAVK